MGRRKIEIKPILHERNRSVTFLKRKNGLFKKAHELGVLCSVQVAVIIFEERPGHNLKLYQYCSSDVRDMIQKHTTFDGERDTKGPGDFASNPTHMFDGHDDDDDDQDEEEEVNARGAKRRVDGKVKPAIIHTGLSAVDMDYGRQAVQQGISASTHNRQVQVPGVSPSLPVSSDRHSVLHESPRLPNTHLSMSTGTRSTPGPYTLRSPSSAAGQSPFPYFSTQTPPPPGSFVTNFNRSSTSGPAYRPRGGNGVAQYETGVYQQMIAQQSGTNAAIFSFMGEDSHGNAQDGGSSGSPNTGNWLDFLSNNPPATGGNGNIASAATSSSAPGSTRRSSDSWERNSRPGSGGPPRAIGDNGKGRLANVEVKTEAQDGI